MKETTSTAYARFLEAYDDVDIEKLSDEDLKSYGDLCQNGVIETDEELRKRGL